MTRRTLATSLAALAITTAPATASPVLSSVVQETERSGWPHRTTAAERAQVTETLLYQETRAGRTSGRILCRFPERMGRFHCGLSVRVHGGTARYRINVKVYEDGSYLVIPGRPVRRNAR